MKFNTKTRYGIRTMIELAMHWKEKGVFQKEISERQEISFKYLDHLIASLKASGLIENAGGRMSGYVLTKDPEDINVYDIYKAFEPELAIIDCLADDSNCMRNGTCATKDFWNGLNKLIIEYLEGTRLQDLAQKQKQINESQADSMFYI
jgi:Rrf2 family protein